MARMKIWTFLLAALLLCMMVDGLSKGRLIGWILALFWAVALIRWVIRKFVL